MPVDMAIGDLHELTDEDGPDWQRAPHRRIKPEQLARLFPLSQMR
jgi:hypothetical protein